MHIDSGPAPDAITAAVATTVAALDLPPTDAALAALVGAYAAELDAAALRAARLDRLLAHLARRDDPEVYDALVVARGLLTVSATLDRIGARLQTGLDALRATPRSRPAALTPAPTGSALGRLRLAAGTDVTDTP